jgi:hypothetical protein
MHQDTREQHSLKNVNKCKNTNNYSDTSDTCSSQSTYQYLNVVHFCNTSAN